MEINDFFHVNKISQECLVNWRNKYIFVFLNGIINIVDIKM